MSSDLLAGLLAALISTNPPTAVSNLVQEKTGISIPVTDPNDPVEKELRAILADDDAAVDDIEKWAAEAQPAPGGADPQFALHERIRERVEGVKRKYEDFVERHPERVRARLAYGSFLHQTGDLAGAKAQWEKAAALDPRNPAAWNNLGDAFQDDDIKKSFEYYDKAIALDPTQSVYYHNLAVSVYMFRTDAEEYWKITEDQVFDKALGLYQKAMALDPGNFVLATDYAECFYGIHPPRWKEGLAAWNRCLKIAHDEVEREGVYIHLGRIQLGLGNFDEARRDLANVTNSMYRVMKNRLTRNLDATIQNVLTNGPPTPMR